MFPFFAILTQVFIRSGISLIHFKILTKIFKIIEKSSNIIIFIAFQNKYSLALEKVNK